MDKTPQERRRIFGAINLLRDDGFNLREMVAKNHLSHADASWYRKYMTPERIEDVRQTHRALNESLGYNNLDDINFDKLFEGWDEQGNWKDEGF